MWKCSESPELRVKKSKIVFNLFACLEGENLGKLKALKTRAWAFSSWGIRACTATSGNNSGGFTQPTIMHAPSLALSHPERSTCFTEGPGMMQQVASSPSERTLRENASQCLACLPGATHHEVTSQESCSWFQTSSLLRILISWGWIFGVSC